MLKDTVHVRQIGGTHEMDVPREDWERWQRWNGDLMREMLTQAEGLRMLTDRQFAHLPYVSYIEPDATLVSVADTEGQWRG